MAPVCAQFGQMSLNKDVSCTKRPNSSAPAAVFSIQSIIADGLAFGPFHLSFQRFLAGGQKKKWTGDLGLPQEQVVRESL